MLSYQPNIWGYMLFVWNFNAPGRRVSLKLYPPHSKVTCPWRLENYSPVFVNCTSIVVGDHIVIPLVHNTWRHSSETSIQHNSIVPHIVWVWVNWFQCSHKFILWMYKYMRVKKLVSWWIVISKCQFEYLYRCVKFYKKLIRFVAHAHPVKTSYQLSLNYPDSFGNRGQQTSSRVMIGYWPRRPKLSLC